MGIRQLKPITPGTRFYSLSAFEEVTTDKPYKSLVAPLKKTGQALLWCPIWDGKTVSKI